MQVEEYVRDIIPESSSSSFLKTVVSEIPSPAEASDRSVSQISQFCLMASFSNVHLEQLHFEFCLATIKFNVSTKTKIRKIKYSYLLL